MQGMKYREYKIIKIIGVYVKKYMDINGERENQKYG